jgi:hypothetical protein
VSDKTKNKITDLEIIVGLDSGQLGCLCEAILDLDPESFENPVTAEVWRGASKSIQALLDHMEQIEGSDPTADAAPPKKEYVN